MARKKNQNQDEPKNYDNLNNDSDDTFGLPEVEYQPLKRNVPQEEEAAHVEETPTEPIETPSYESTSAEEVTSQPEETRQEEYEQHVHEEHVHEEHVEEDHDYRSVYSQLEEEKSPVWPKVLGFVLFFLIAAGAVYYFAVYQPERRAEAERERARQEELARERARRAEEARLAEQLRLEAEQRRLDSLANLNRVGSVERLAERTGRYYVIAASAIDDDLLMDYANKLVKKGTQVKIIPPFGKTKFSRLAVDSRESYDDAQAAADGLKGGEYGNQLWVIRY